MKGNEMAELRTEGATLAMMKIEEIRRDNDENNKLITTIKSLPQPTDPVPFGTEPRLAYRLQQRSQEDPAHTHRRTSRPFPE